MDYKKYLWSPLVHPNTREYLAIGVLSAIITFVSFGAKLWAPLYGVTDYKIIEKIKEKKVDDFTFIERIEDQWKKTLRFDFVKSHLRNLEIKTFSKNATPYYIVRIFLYFYTFMLIWVAISKYSSPLIALGITMVFLGSKFWFSIIAQIELEAIYKLIGPPLYLVAFFKLLHAKDGDLNGKLKWTITLLIGGLISQGTEEMFFIFFIPLFYLIAIQFKSNISHGSVVFTLLSPLLLWGIVAFYGIYTQPNGDEMGWYHVYHDNNNFRINYFFYLFKKFSWFKFSSAFFFCLFLASKTKKTRLQFADFFNDYTKELYFVIFSAFTYFEFISISYQAYYFGVWPNNDSKDFPGILINPAAICCIYYLLIKLKDQFVNPDLVNFTKQVKTYLTLGLFTYTFGLYVKDCGVFGFCKSTIADTKQAISINKNIQRIIKQVEHDSTITLALWLQDLKELKIAEGLAYYFRDAGLKNPIFIEITNELKTGNSSDIPIELAEVEIMYNARIMGLLGYTPWSKVIDEAKCYSLGILSDPKDLNCKNIGKLIE